MIKDNEEFANDRYIRIKEELEVLKNAQDLAAYRGRPPEKARILDGKG
jgi:uncharacterized membrane protein